MFNLKLQFSEKNSLRASIENLMLFYLDRIYCLDKPQAAEKAFSYLSKIEDNKLSLTRSISSYYYCIINGDIPSAIKILDYLRIIGFKNINSTLPSFD